MKTYWISFANEQNLGCCIIDAESEEGAYTKANELGLNPGGEVLVLQIDTTTLDGLAEIGRWGKNRLISKEELINDGYKTLPDMDDDIINDVMASGSIICEDCNESGCDCKND